ncbi:MAG: hypothetical protein OHK0012_09780 [Synechococcales cyanobacterium]
MNHNISKYELIILDIVVLGGFPVNLLVSPNLQEIANKKIGLELSGSQLIQILEKMVNNGDIVFVYFIEDCRENFFIPSVDQIRDALYQISSPPQLSVHYILTQQGGEKWENYVKPNWDLYIYSSRLNHKMTFRATSKRIIDERIHYLLYLDHCVIDINSLAWNEIKPWDATYWKTLPRGMEAVFNYSFVQKINKKVFLDWDKMSISAWDWYHRTSNWYDRIE